MAEISGSFSRFDTEFSKSWEPTVPLQDLVYCARRSFHYPLLPIRFGPVGLSTLLVDPMEICHDLIGRVTQLEQDTPDPCAGSTASADTMDKYSLTLLQAADNGPGDDADGVLFPLRILG